MPLPQGWVALAETWSGPEAALLADLLRGHGVPVYVQHLRKLPGLEEGDVIAVPESFLERARELLPGGSFSEAELDELATRDPGADAET